jgi:hypothetical protein
MTCRHMIQVQIEPGLIVCAFCEEDITIGDGIRPVEGGRKLTDEELLKLKAANDFIAPL